MTVANRHTAIRPIWLCRKCAHPWPCGEAKVKLLREFAQDRVALSVYAAGHLFDAAQDLYKLNPYDGPTPPELFKRFVSWTRPTSMS